jgi:aminoglycoside phosphotransferase (APT) family kinase protein
VDFQRRRPSAEAIAWVERALGGGARVVACRRLTGGVTAAVHRLTVATEGGRQVVVLRQYEQAATDDPQARAQLDQLVLREARVLDAVTAAKLPAPELLAASTNRAETGGPPSILMTRLRGQVSLSPADPDSWLKQIALVAARIHDAPVAAPPFERWLDPARLTAPASSVRPGLWQAVKEVLRQDGGSGDACFIHRDFQHFNFLWTRGRLTGVVDWGAAAIGPPGLDLGHCRLNLAVLFGADWAERLRRAYEAETGRSVDPWWDLHALASYSDYWQRFIPIQVDGRAPVDTDGMTARVEEVLAATLQRLR